MLVMKNSMKYDFISWFISFILLFVLAELGWFSWLVLMGVLNLEVFMIMLYNKKEGKYNAEEKRD